MYGVDILIDANCKPWIVEINASPSLSTTSKVDMDLKMDLINDIYKIVMPDDWNEDSTKTGANTCTLNQVGGYTVLYDES
jgi:tubulin polyglutamylase TTLL1